MAISPVCELLERNNKIFDNKKVLLCGDIYDPSTLALIKNSAIAYILCDNYIAAQKMAAMIGLSMDESFPQVLQYKHVTILFTTPKDALEYVKDIDTLVILLAKNKQLTLKLLSLFTPIMPKGAYVYTAGSNDGGGKSANTILKALGPTYKIDLARKCTLFEAKVENEYKGFKEPNLLTLEINKVKLTLKQDPSVFSEGKLDKGTSLLLDAIKDIIPQGKALDLGCGCGVVGCYLSKLGFKNVTLSDVSAQALSLSTQNLELNEIIDANVVASDMLSNVGVFDYIIVNPPFHVGINTTTAPAINMMISAKDHLSAQGSLYLVANSHLGYEKVLHENFSNVEEIIRTNAFVVFKATN